VHKFSQRNLFAIAQIALARSAQLSSNVRTKSRDVSRVHSPRIMKFSLVTCLCVLVSTSSSPQQPNSSNHAGRRVAIGVLAPREEPRDSATASSSRGVTLGIEEAVRTASLFGWKVVELQAPDSLDAAAALRLLSAMGATAIVGNLTLTLQRAHSGSGPILFDVGRHQHPPRSDCGDSEFHLLPLVDPADGAEQAKPDSSVHLLAWSSSLERFGAAQLNQRYQKRFGLAMDEYAWAGWMSIKVLLDAVLKKGTADPCALEAFLLTGARFDGHKGVPLFFDPETRYLVQPLFAPSTSGEPESVDVYGASTAQRRRSGASSCRSVCA